MITRRRFLGASAAALVGSAHAAHAEPAAAGAAPVLFVSHGTPLFMPGNEPRIAELRAWGAKLPTPRGIVVMTPHFAARTLQLGRSGPGFAMYNLPGFFKKQLAPDLEYATPSSEALATRLEGLLGQSLERPERRGFDHTTWMPLKSLLPNASVPVIELGYPFPSAKEAFALGRRLAPLRDEGILFLASGGMTHNLAASPAPGEPHAAGAQAPSFVAEFDAWAAERITKRAVDDLVDFRHRAPAVELAHPDDGAHYRVLLVALGIALHAQKPVREIRFPIAGIEASQSKRCVELV
jgi:4,5-DOPA dioxygenase extradiol